MSEQMDKIFREKLGRYKVTVSSAPDIWSAIAKDQAKKRRRSRLIKAAKYAGVLLLLIAITWPTYSYFSNSNTETNSLQAPTIPVTESTPIAANTNETATLADTKTTNALTNTTSSNIKTTAQTESSHQKTVREALQEKASLVNAHPTPTENTEAQQKEVVVAVPAATKENAQPAATEVSNTVNYSSRQLVDLPGLPLPILSPREATLPKLDATFAGHDQQHFQKTAKRRLEIDLLAGPAYANQQFKLQKEDDRALLNAREISEFPSVSIIAGIRTAYSLSPRWSVRSGLLYTQIRNQFEYEQRSAAPSETTILIKSSNQIKMLEVPLMASYTLPGKRFRLALNAGPIINISTKTNGRYLLPDLMEPVNLEDDNIYKKNVGINYQFSLTAAYDLGMGNSLLIEPTFKNYRTSFTHGAYALDERYWLAGLQIGLRHRIK